MDSFPRLKQWIFHHTTSVIATGTDFVSMVAAVELLGVSPVAATAVGATVGATTNFILARQWTYRRADGAAVQVQLARYLVVALVSLGLNALGEHLFANVLHVHYVLGRVITAVIVSNAWNYPMQRFFVFSDGGTSGAKDRGGKTVKTGGNQTVNQNGNQNGKEDRS